MRRIGLTAALAALALTAWAVAGARADGTHSYRIEMLNAFGILEGSEVRIAGVRSGTVTEVDVNEAKRAVAGVELSGPAGVLGERTTCTTEPQSLIAEYFIDCDPRGEPLPEGALVPAERVTQSIQIDLVQNALREPFRERARLIVNELGTALAGNSENLNAAIRLSVPALGELRALTRILARQRRALGALTVDAERVLARLAERRGDVVAAVSEARDAAAIAASRRDELERVSARLDDFTAELRPALAALGELARQGTPVLAALRAAAPDLNGIAAALPGFNAAAGDALVALAAAAGPGTAALEEGRDEVGALRRAGRDAAPVAEILADLVRDLDDPRRIVEVDRRAARTCDDATAPCHATGREAPTGYTALEGLLNYVYYQAGAINQFDSVGHILQFNVFEAGTGPCGGFNARDDVPAAGGGRTADILEADPCVSWLGPNQPGVSFDLGLPPYHSSVCPDGSTHPELCDPDAPAEGGGSAGAGSPGEAPLPGGAGGGGTGTGPAAGARPPRGGGNAGALPDLGALGEALGLPELEDALEAPQGLGGLRPGTRSRRGQRRGSERATRELMDFLFGNGEH